METLAALGHGFAVALTPWNLLWSLLGVIVGTASACYGDRAGADRGSAFADNL
jgi:hypothetical protein